MDVSAECVILVILEMCLSFLGIVCNLLIVATVRQDETLRASTLNFLLFNLCFSNLLIAFLVKPISAIYVGYAISTGRWQVSLAFCTMYTFTYRTTWCIFPFTLMAMCWSKLFAQCRCGRCGILCCARNKGKSLQQSHGAKLLEVGQQLSQQNSQIITQQPTRSGSNTLCGPQELQQLNVIRGSARRMSAYFTSPFSSVQRQHETTTNSHCPSEVRPLSANCTPYVQQTTSPQSTGGKLHPQSSLKSRSRNPSTAGRPNQNSSNSGNSGGSSGPKSLGPLGANTSSPSNTSVLYNYNNTSITITNPECLENGSASYMTAASYHDGVGGSGGGATSSSSKAVRTLEDGPTARQKFLVSSIWVMSALFGAATCFPDKVFGVSVVRQLGEDFYTTPTTTTHQGFVTPGPTYTTVMTSSLMKRDLSSSEILGFENEVDYVDSEDPSILSSTSGGVADKDLSYCTVKTGVNDLLDYISLAVALIIPLVLGPLVVGVLQGLFSIFGLFVCQPDHAIHEDQRNRKEGPGWPIIIGFTLVFLATYPLHMYVSEVYLADDTRSFAFLLLKYCVGFLYLIFIPIVTLAFQEEIRNGVYTVFDGTTSVGNPNNNPAEMAALAAAEAAAAAAATSPGSGDRQSSRVNST